MKTVYYMLKTLYDMTKTLTETFRFYILLIQTAVLLSLGVLLASPSVSAVDIPKNSQPLTKALVSLGTNFPDQSGAYIFEKGEEALLARAWLTDHAEKSINVQYFIWSTDNIGILAAEALLRAAERGVKVRVIVDDLLIDAPSRIMLALNAHPGVTIKIYNPKHSVGISTMARLKNLLFSFRSANQRMHDKTFSVDGAVAITGGRNMADEYFDYNRSYNFRDRDILLLGPVVKDVDTNFETFWNSPFVTGVDKLLADPADLPTNEEKQAIYVELHDYAKDPQNFEPAVRKALTDMPVKFPLLAKALIWDDIVFTHDEPGKNKSNTLSGGGSSTSALTELLANAQESVTIQSPYLVMPKGGIEFFKNLVDRGVKVRICTNSLASTDNLQAFSGYLKQRKEILAAGIDVYEFQPRPAIQKELIDRYQALKKEVPIFAIHAKSMVIDRNILFVGTFNLDPRSANLNTEVGVIIKNKALAEKLEKAIEKDMAPGNSWNSRVDAPDRFAPRSKRIKAAFWKLLPLTPLL